MYEGKFPHKRYKLTLEFLSKHIDRTDSILDLGVQNPFTEILTQNGYTVKNTTGLDLDEDTSEIKKSEAEIITAFEIFDSGIKKHPNTSNLKHP